jgi:hypothetical protein
VQVNGYETIILNVIMVVLGVFFVLGAFYTTGIRGALGGGDFRPITFTGRVIIFLTGLLALWRGLAGLLK